MELNLKSDCHDVAKVLRCDVSEGAALYGMINHLMYLGTTGCADANHLKQLSYVQDAVRIAKRRMRSRLRARAKRMGLAE